MLITLTSVVIGPSMERERIDAALKPESGLMTSGVCSATSWLILQKVLGQQEAEFKGKLGHIPIPVSLRLNTGIKPYTTANDPCRLRCRKWWTASWTSGKPRS